MPAVSPFCNVNLEKLFNFLNKQKQILLPTILSMYLDIFI